MDAPRKLDWTIEAKEDMARIHRFVVSQWGERIADRFLDLVGEFEDLVVTFPYGFKASPLQPELRLGIVHRNVWAVYRVEAERILIIAMLDTRADNSSFV